MCLVSARLRLDGHYPFPYYWCWSQPNLTCPKLITIIELIIYQHLNWWNRIVPNWNKKSVCPSAKRSDRLNGTHLSHISFAYSRYNPILVCHAPSLISNVIRVQQNRRNRVRLKANSIWRISCITYLIHHYDYINLIIIFD